MEELINPGQRHQGQWPPHHTHHLELVLQMSFVTYCEDMDRTTKKWWARNDNLKRMSNLRAPQSPCHPRHQSRPCHRLPCHHLPHPEVSTCAFY